MEVADEDAPVNRLSWRTDEDGCTTIVIERLGIRTRSQQKYPGRRSVGSIVNMRLGIRYSVRFVQFENLPRSMNCEMQARNRLFSGICKQWEQLWNCRLEGFNTTVVGPLRSMPCLSYCVWFGLECDLFCWYAEKWEISLFGVTEKYNMEITRFRTNQQVEVL